LLADPKLNLPQRLTASAQAIEVYPEILPLFAGKINLKKARIRQPDLTIMLPKSTAEDKAPASPVAVGDLIRNVSASLAALPEFNIPTVNGSVTKGRVKLVYDKTTAFELRDVEADLRSGSDKVTFQITAASDIVNSVSISGWTNLRQITSSARIVLKTLRPGIAYNALWPDAALKIQDADTDLTIDFTMDNAEKIKLDYNLAIPHFKLVKAGQTVDLKTRGLKGSLSFNKNSATLSLTELVLEDPPMRLSGNLLVSVEDPQLRLQFEGRNIDIKAARKAVLAVAGTAGVIQDIFDIIKGGKVPLITVTDQANSLNDLGDWDNLVVRVQMQQGDVTIPGVQLEVTDAAGDVVISQGILAAENLQAKLGNSWARNGKLKLDLTQDVMPLQVEAGLQAAMADLPAILNRLIDDKEVRQELALIQDLQGSANGKLVLGGDTDQVQVSVSASDIQLGARYRKIPYPLTITDGNFTYDGNRIAWGQLSGTIGKSSFAALTGGLDPAKNGNLAITSGTFRILVTEILAWLSSDEKLRELSKYHGGGASIIRLSAMDLKGPLQDFRRWHFNIAGEVEDLVVQNLPGRPGPLKIASLKFNVDPQTFRYFDGRLSMLDGAWHVSGTHRRYLAGIDKDVRLTFAGHMGPQTTRWFSQVLRAPPWLKLRPLTLATSHLNYANNGKSTLSASLAVQDGLKISTNMRLGSDELVVEKLVIHDRTSQATLNLTYKNQTLDASFNGNLHKSTLDQLFQEKAHLSGWIDGNIRVHLDLKHLYNLSLDGELNGHDLLVPLNSKTPLRVNALALKGDRHTIFLKSADLSWSDMRLTMSGSVEPRAPKHLWLDLDIDADSVDVDHLIQTLKGKNDHPDQKSAARSPALPVQGNIRVKAERVKISKLTVQPLQADISLQNDVVAITLKDTRVCGIAAPGTLKVSLPNLQFDLKPGARDQELNTTLNCLANETFKADGKFDLAGHLQGRGKAQDLLKTASGHLDLKISDGHVYRDIIVLNVVKFLNVTQVLTDRVSPKQMTEKGFGFKFFRIQSSLQDGRMRYEKIILTGDEMTITGTGEIDLLHEHLDFTLLVAPQKTLDSILGHIPLIGAILHTIDTIPLSIKGTYNDIHVFPLSPAAVGYELKQVMKNTLGIPIKLTHPGGFHQSEGSGEE
ncbi:MAG: AsmA-like C-terminal domain-containing protein, partial [Deltaproteobacteria bacterium]|nr:AsmA-like C-terminal domain-containing protein [Deltaproteobacteria bacterium]